MLVRIGSRVIAVALALCAVTAHAQTAGRVTRESVSSGDGESSGHASKAAVSADGRYVAFQSDSSELVPGDTNGNGDVFVRDRVTGFVQRVSLTWNGSEARGDSQCPALSADGRFVAFLNRATNMLPGSSNASFRYMVYVYDRREGALARVSTSASGGEPDADSGCPALSYDGQLVAFASDAANLVAGDVNKLSDVFLVDRARRETRLLSKGGDGRAADGASVHAAISGDGRFVAFESAATNLLPRDVAAPSPARLRQAQSNVYVHDVAAATSELVSVAAGRPELAANRPSSLPAISADGRYVVFRSEATNLTSPPVFEPHKMYVRDRTTAATWLANPSSQAQDDCGRDGVKFHCSPGALGRPTISGDGRFVAFSSRSLRHLPANQYHGDQIYLFDNVGRRLRRLSVDPTGVPGERCSWEPALSADGKVLAYSSKSTNIAPGDADADGDVLGHEWSCNDAGTCRPLAACPAVPKSCEQATSSLLRLRKHPPGGADEDQLYWRWYGEPSTESFPDPAGAGTYQLCVYASALALDVAAPEAPGCEGGTRPCWRKLSSGYKLVDPRGAITDLTVSGSPQTRRIHLHGNGKLLDAPYLPLDAAKGIVVQLQETGSDRCWGAAFPAASITKNVAGVAGAGSRRDGFVVAEIR